MAYFRDQSTIILFVLLFMPGFVSTRIYDLMVPGRTRDYAKSIYETIGYSLITYALWSWAVVPIWLGWIPPLWAAIVLTILVLAVTPAILPWLFLTIVRRLSSNVISPYPTSWDWAFAENQTAMLLVHLRDGRRVGGTWSGAAFSSSYPVPPDLYLAEVWNVDQETGEFLTQAVDSKGLLLWGSDIEMVEFFELEATRSWANGRRESSRSEA